MTQRPRIRVAVIGGGLGGTVLMNRLMTYPHIDAHVYEAKTSLQERGASVGLAVNAQKALQLMELGDVMKKAGAVPLNGGRCYIGQGHDEGKVAIDVSIDLQTVHRHALLTELLAPIPADRLHTDKKLASIDEIGKKVTFEDGTSIDTDVIIGADGIHSLVRKHVLGDGHPAVDPVYAGIWDCRGLVAFDKAVEKLGPERITNINPRQTIYVGNGALLLHDNVDDNKLISLLGGGLVPKEWSQTEWKKTVSKDWLHSQYKGWPEFANGMVDLLFDDKDEIPVFVEWESPEAPTLFNKTTVIMGDAAHATTPWQGAGLGQAIEDAMIIQAALGQCEGVEDVPLAFQAYDELMRPRGQRVVNSSREMGMICLGQHGLDAEKVGALQQSKWDFIHGWDAKAAVSDTIEKVKQYRQSR